MTLRKLRGPGSTGSHDDERSAMVRRIDAALRKAADKGIEPPSLMVCDPQGEKEKRLHNYLESVEPGLCTMAATETGYEFSVVLLDKSRQNPINKLGGQDEAGEQSMKAYWKTSERAASLVAGIYDNPIMRLELIRVSPTSDEGILVIGGMDLEGKIKAQFGAEASLELVFDRAWKMARKELAPETYTYSINVPLEGRSYDLDLRSFSRMLRHPEMIVACSFSVSSPAKVPLDRRGFIMERIRDAGNAEIPFFNDLPGEFRRISDHGLPEVVSPFDTSLQKMVKEDPALRKMDRGVFVDTKLRMRPDVARGLLTFTSDRGDFEGTRKGYAGIFSGDAGMTLFNTYAGKPRTNGVLTPIAQAMGEIDGQVATVIPLNGGYLQFWADLPANDETATLIRRAIARRIHAKGANGDPGYADLDFEPVVMVLDAEGMDIAEARNRFILGWMGKSLYPPKVLDMTDFMLNFFENVHPSVQLQIYDALAMSENGGRPVHMHDFDRMQMVRRVCASRRTIRDTEDFVYTLRNDEELPADIKANKGTLEQWLFDFAHERFGQIFKLWVKRIAQEKERFAA
ncbi:MAG: hypothetical protein AB1529_01905 [Candidatus Micrarchaeota archaeon]